MKNQTKKTARRNPKTGLLPGEKKRGVAPGYRTFCLACWEDLTDKTEPHTVTDCIINRPGLKLNVSIRKHGGQK